MRGHGRRIVAGWIVLALLLAGPAGLWPGGTREGCGCRGPCSCHCAAHHSVASRDGSHCTGGSCVLRKGSVVPAREPAPSPLDMREAVLASPVNLLRPFWGGRPDSPDEDLPASFSRPPVPPPPRALA
ncbi:MAG TPA: hypothetical protein VLQ45_03770 [Thermoanaerobaculia bacterium]|nr:hypothetical protein [Thermoanaerobaculia bacterium]